jgi:hypothetical protein
MAKKIIVALVAFIVSIALAFAGLNYANNLNPATEGISISLLISLEYGFRLSLSEVTEKKSK